jgi:hypothetical protein
MTSAHITRDPSRIRELDERILLVDDTDEDATALLSVICDGDPRNRRGFDFDGYSRGGRA